MFSGKSSIFGFSYMHSIKITTKSLSSNLFFLRTAFQRSVEKARAVLYILGYFEKNILDKIDNKNIMK